ncbi:MAG TPA: hypothetical protein VH592_20760 [Gemmataceae bacterium]|jgi:hypothetical protein
MHRPDQWQTGLTSPMLELPLPAINVDVRKRAFDPFLSGVAIGAVAAIFGMLLGLLLFSPR